MSDYLKELINATGNEFASKVSDGMLGNVHEHIDTGSYILNALLSGSIYKGLPANKITAFAGESATGKTFSYLVLSNSFLPIILLVVFCILSLNLLLLLK